MLSQVVINQGNFALQNRAENVVQTVVHCFSIMSGNKLIINKIIPLSQSPLGSPEGSSTHRRPLKIVDFQWLFFYGRPRYDAKYFFLQNRPPFVLLRESYVRCKRRLNCYDPKTQADDNTVNRHVSLRFRSEMCPKLSFL